MALFNYVSEVQIRLKQQRNKILIFDSYEKILVQ